MRGWTQHRDMRRYFWSPYAEVLAGRVGVLSSCCVLIVPLSLVSLLIPPFFVTLARPSKFVFPLPSVLPLPLSPPPMMITRSSRRIRYNIRHTCTDPQRSRRVVPIEQGERGGSDIRTRWDVRLRAVCQRTRRMSQRCGHEWGAPREASGTWTNSSIECGR